MKFPVALRAKSRELLGMTVAELKKRLHQLKKYFPIASVGQVYRNWEGKVVVITSSNGQLPNNGTLVVAQRRRVRDGAAREVQVAPKFHDTFDMVRLCEDGYVRIA
jgi:hypothetical protein